MLILEKIKKYSTWQKGIKNARVVIFLQSFLLLTASSRGAMYYSTGIPQETELSNTTVPLIGSTSKIQLAVTAPTAGANITATVSLPLAGSARLR